MKKSYKKEAVSGVKWTSLSSIIIAGGSFLLIIVLTNILDKKDFGLFALVNVVVGFSAEFVDIGISQAIVQKQEVNKNQLSTLYWLNICLAVIVFLVVNATSNLVGDFYNEDELPNLLFWISFSFLCTGFSAQFQALLQKQLQFKVMSVIEIISFVAYLGSTLFFALNGYGVFSLVWGALIKAFVKSLLLVIIGLKYHTPNFYFNIKEVKYFLNFGSFRTGAFLVSFLNTQLDSILIGKFIGVGELGVYDVFKRIVKQPVRFLSPIIQKVVYPLLSKVNNDKERMSDMFVKVLELLNLIRFPVFIGIALIAPEIISLFLGDAWSEHVVVLQLLAFVFLFRTVQSFVGQLIFACGKANWSFYNNLILLPLNCIAIYIGGFWGIMGVSSSLIILNIIVLIPKFEILIKKLVKLNLLMFLSLIFKDMLILGFLAIIITGIIELLVISTISTIVLKIALFVLLYLSFLLVFKKNTISYIKNLLVHK